MVEESSGWNTASEAAQDASDAAEEIEAEILATLPTTLAGLAAKARWASRPVIHEGYTSRYARQIVEDVVAMAERGGAET